MSKEPAVGIGVVISLFLTILWQILTQYGVAVGDDLRTSTEALVQAILLLPAVTGFLIRANVVPVSTVKEVVEQQRSDAQQTVNQAFAASPGDPKPALPPKPTI